MIGRRRERRQALDEAAVLNRLDGAPASAYELMKALRWRTSRVYLTLQRLDHQGLVTYSKGPPRFDGGPPKHFYLLTVQTVPNTGGR